MLRAFSDNLTCRHIIFGGCHDAGYLLNLDQFKHNEQKANRITLLESTPAYRGFVDLPNFRRARFDQVFRTEPLPESAPAVNTSFPQSPPTQPAKQQSPGLSRASTMNKTPPILTSASRAISPAPSTPASSVTEPPTESSEDSSYAAVGKGGAVSEVVSIAPGKKQTNVKKKYAYFNKAEQRLDEPLPPKDRGSAESLESRMMRSKKKMCNHFHLGGKCEQGRFCHFQHEPRLPAGELNALKYKTRSLMCKNRYCDNIDCCEWTCLSLYSPCADCC
jgi:hypothetical protein